MSPSCILRSPRYARPCFFGEPSEHISALRLVPVPGAEEQGQEGLSAFDSADQIGAALQGSIVVSLNVLPNDIYLLIPSTPSLRNPAQVTAWRESLPCEEEEGGALVQDRG